MEQQQRVYFSSAACPPLFGPQQHTNGSQLRINGSLRFALVQSTRQAAPPFASLSAARQVAANPLFSLSRLTDSGSSSDIGSSEAAGGSSSSGGRGDGSSSGYESGTDTDTGFGSDLQLDKINCQLCQKPLSHRGGGRGLLGRRRHRKTSSANEFQVCDCCQRCYHERCCKDKGISTKQGGDMWFHSSACKECYQGLRQQVQQGAVSLPSGRSWQLIDCQPVSPKDQGGIKMLQALKRNLGDVLEVLLPSYGPAVAQQLVDTTQGFAVLLRQDELPVSAGLLDVYGQEVAVLDLVATQLEEQGKGHCTAMVKAVEGWLGPQLGVASLVAVCPGDEPDTIKAWQHKFGFQRINQRQLRQLQASVPPLNYYEDSVLLSKPLPKQQKQQQQKQQQQQQEQQQK